MPAAQALKHVREVVFPYLRQLGDGGSSFQRYMATAEFKINKASLLVEACAAIDEMNISQQHQDVQGDIYEHLLGHLGQQAGRNGQFFTPRHIIRMMVQMVDPRPGERIGDLAAGTCGFLVNAYQHILETHTSPDILRYDEQGWPHNLTGDLLTDQQRAALTDRKAFRGYDNDSGQTMHRIGSMNLILHGIESPQYFYADTLSKAYDEPNDYDVILMNPPFKGSIDKDDINDELPNNTVSTEILFIHRILRALDMGGRCAVIVPDGVLFGSTKAHVTVRRKIIDSNCLIGVISMPAGVFQPYAGLSTAILLFSRGGHTADHVWFYEMAADGFSLDKRRQPISANDIPDLLACWNSRDDPDFYEHRELRRAKLRTQLDPLHEQRLHLEGQLNSMQFDQVIRNADSPASQGLTEIQRQLAVVQRKIAPLQTAVDRLARHFYATIDEIKANRYDLSAARYRTLEIEPSFYEEPRVTMQRLLRIERLLMDEVTSLEKLLL